MVQALAVVFVVVALGAIVWRFTPRSADGSMRLPAVVDNSVGVFLLRRALRRPTETTESLGRPETATVAEATADEIARRIGVAGRPPPTASTAPTARTGPAAPGPPSGALSAAPGSATRADGRRLGARPPGALAAQRRWAGAAALVVVGVATVTLAVGGRQLDGGVLSMTGTPGASANGVVGGSGGDPAAASPSASAGALAH